MSDDTTRRDTATPDPATSSPPAQAATRLAINEDWAATVLGLALLVLVLVGAVPAWLVP